MRPVRSHPAPHVWSRAAASELGSAALAASGGAETRLPSRKEPPRASALDGFFCWPSTDGHEGHDDKAGRTTDVVACLTPAR